MRRRRTLNDFEENEQKEKLNFGRERERGTRGDSLEFTVSRGLAVVSPGTLEVVRVVVSG